jgi:1-acyl-sn-glycerol-3-phosphate acyltransferase
VADRWVKILQTSNFDIFKESFYMIPMTVHPIYRIVIFIAKMMFSELFDGDIYGYENIPRYGPCLLACNHLSYFDPPFIGSAVPGREVFSLARSSLFSTKFRHWLFSNMNCIPLDRKSGDVMAIKTALHLLKNGKCVMIYPEGTRSADGSIGEPLAGIGMLACKMEVPVIPCRIFGTFEVMNRNAKFFDWNQKATIVFGQPILPKDYIIAPDSREKYKLTATYIMNIVQNLQIPEVDIS